MPKLTDQEITCHGQELYEKFIRPKVEIAERVFEKSECV